MPTESSVNSFMERELTDRAIVLRTTPLKESDLMISFLSARHGKISGIAKGARNSKRRFLGGIEVFDTGEFSLAKGRNRDSGPYLVNSLSERELWPRLRSDLDRFRMAVTILEISECFAPEGDADASRLFEPLVGTLRALNLTQRKDEALQLCARYIYSALKISGFDPNQDPDVPLNIRNDLPAPSLESAATAFLFLTQSCEHILGRALRSRS